MNSNVFKPYIHCTEEEYDKLSFFILRGIRTSTIDCPFTNKNPCKKPLDDCQDCIDTKIEWNVEVK